MRNGDNRFVTLARDAGVLVDEEAAGCLLRYRDLILEASQRFNLTAVRTSEAIERRHLIESLVCGRLLADAGLLPHGCRVLDLGSGAGLPGLPLKIARPDLRLALLEANGKRCRFLREAAAALALGEVDVLEGRAEVLGREASLRETFDLVVARAVAPLPVLLELALPFTRVGGCVAAIKGSAAASELAQSRVALDALGGELEPMLALDVLGLPAQRLIVVEKKRPTPERYPRRSGVPGRRPLA